MSLKIFEIIPGNSISTTAILKTQAALIVSNRTEKNVVAEVSLTSNSTQLNC